MKLSKDYVKARHNKDNPPLSSASEELKQLVENAVDNGEQFFITNGYILLPEEFEAKVFQVPYCEYCEIVKWWEEYKWCITLADVAGSKDNRYCLIALTC